MDYILAVNAGSSSIKAAAYASDDGRLRETARFTATDLGLKTATLHCTIDGQETREPMQGTYTQAAGQLLQRIQHSISDKVAGIGHRLVHGGPDHAAPERITPELLNTLQALTPYDPEHTPAALALIAMAQANFPGTPQIACFDTAFFHDMPHLAQLLPLPREYEKLGLRRYGFHGLSYTYLMQALEAQFGRECANSRVVLAHLGSGASLAAVYRGAPIDTTMSFTPASGILMSSRAGDLDPGISWFLHQQAGVTPKAFNDLVNTQSGLLGVSGISADMYTLIQHEANSGPAADAVNLFCYQVKKAIGALSATLGGIDTLVFSGGIGEQSSLLRARIAEGLEYLGIQLSTAANDQHAGTISSGRVAVHVIPTDETQVIAAIVRAQLTD